MCVRDRVRETQGGVTTRWRMSLRERGVRKQTKTQSFKKRDERANRTRERRRLLSPYLAPQQEVGHFEYRPHDQGAEGVG